MTVFAGVDLLIGIDDTDDQFSPGTGRRARAPLRELAAAGLGSEAGATRHQLLVDDRVPYTSHNSTACLTWRSPDGDPHAVRGEIIEYVSRFLERVCPPAADPGFAVAVPADVADVPALVNFGRRAKREVATELPGPADSGPVQLATYFIAWQTYHGGPPCRWSHRGDGSHRAGARKNTTRRPAARRVDRPRLPL